MILSPKIKNFPRKRACFKRNYIDWILKALMGELMGETTNFLGRPKKIELRCSVQLISSEICVFFSQTKLLKLLRLFTISIDIGPPMNHLLHYLQQPQPQTSQHIFPATFRRICPAFTTLMYSTTLSSTISRDGFFPEKISRNFWIFILSRLGLQSRANL